MQRDATEFVTELFMHFFRRYIDVLFVEFILFGFSQNSFRYSISINHCLYFGGIFNTYLYSIYIYLLGLV